MINCEIDGIWCPKCKELHPTLYWHQKYNDYLLNRREVFEENKKKRPKLFGDAEYTDSLFMKELEESSEMGKCVCCEGETFFKNTKTGNFVCSDECKYKDNEMNS